jgi:hypothetical protein
MDHIEQAIDFDVVDPDIAWGGRDNRRDGFVWAPAEIARIDDPTELPAFDGAASSTTSEPGENQRTSGPPGV